MSWLERRDDRARLLAFGLVAVTLSLTQTVPGIALGWAVGFVVAASSGLAPRVALRRLAPVLVLLVPVALFTPFWAPPWAPDPLLAAWPSGPTVAGTWRALRITAHALGLTLLAVGAFAVPLPRTLAGLHGLRVPAPLVHIALLTVRFVEQVDDELARVRRALLLRGFRPRADLATSRTYAGVTGALLVRSLQRTERVEAAMRLRGYAGHPVLPAAPAWRAADTALVLAAAAVAGVVAAWELHGRGLL